MNPCECGCGRLVKNRWARGHQYRKGRGNLHLGEPLTGMELQTGGAEPPPYPNPIDRRRYRLASERPGTNVFNAWRETRCSNCHERMFTRDMASTYEHGAVCEECDFRLRSEIQETKGQRFNAQARTIPDPFKPRV